MMIRSRNLYIYPENPAFLQKQESAIVVWGRLRRPEDAGTSSGVSRGLVPGGLRRPGTQLVCLQHDRGSNRPENWLSRFLVADQSGTVWGLLRLPEADLYLIPGFDTDSVFPPILPFF